MAFKIFGVALWAALVLWFQAVHGYAIDLQWEFADQNPCPVKVQEENGSMTTSSGRSPVVLTFERIHEIRQKYDDLFWRQPNVISVGEGRFRNPDRTPCTGPGAKNGIIVGVTAKVDQSTLPVADRIPTTLEGVPVQILIKGVPTFYLPDPTPGAQESSDEGNGS